jgi:hypothetical protein
VQHTYTMINDDKQTSHSSPNDEKIRKDGVLSMPTTCFRNSSASSDPNFRGESMQQSRYKLPVYRPKRSGSVLKHWEHAVPSDNDLWVEHSYKNKHGQDIYYYFSMLTGKRQLLEPLTGAATIVYQEEIAADPTLRYRVPGPLLMEQLRGIRRHRPSLHLEGGSIKNAVSNGTSRHSARTLIGRFFRLGPTSGGGRQK